MRLVRQLRTMSPVGMYPREISRAVSRMALDFAHRRGSWITALADDDPESAQDNINMDGFENLQLENIRQGIRNVNIREAVEQSMDWTLSRHY